MINLKHITRVGEIFWTYAVRKKAHTNYLPYRLWIEPTSMCNLKCVMCANKNLDPDEIGMMDFGLFKKIIDEAKFFVHDVNMHHRGESLLHKEIFEMIKYAKKNGVILKLHTNATALNEKNAIRLLKSDLDFISFSFDGLDKDTYERYRVGAKFEKTIENIIRFLNIKNQLKKKKPYTVLELIDFTEDDDSYNLSRLSEFKKLFMGLPLDKLTVKKPHNFAGNIDINTTNGKITYSPCTFLWHSLIIFWNGDVSPCTQDFHGEMILGNVNDSTMAEIFNGEELVALRDKALKGELESHVPCSNCDMIKRKRFFGIPVNSLRYLQK